jgi:hypothetical protein
MMAAFDTDNQPVISGGNFTVNNGQGIMKIPTSGLGDKKMSGTVKIRKKSGDWAEKPWSYTVKVIKPAGSISLLDMNVLFIGWNNRVQGVASGFDKVSLNGVGCSVTPSGGEWIAKPTVGAGKTCKITIRGTSSVTKKGADLGFMECRVKPLPPAQVYFGKTANNGTGSKYETNLSASLGPDGLLPVKFSVLSWEMEFKGRTVKGSGSKLDATAQNLLKQAGPGTSAYFTVQYKNLSNGKTFPGTCRVNF